MPQVKVDLITEGGNTFSILSIAGWGILKRNIATGDLITGSDQGLTENDILHSAPPEGKCKVKNLYVDPATGKLVVEYDDGGQ